ncbi:MAG: hypothetical protein RL664_158 [Bacteroidota bacterium]
MDSELNGKILRLLDFPELKEDFEASFFSAFQHLPQVLLQQIWDIDYVKKTVNLKSNPETTFIVPWIVNEKVLAYLAFQEDGTNSFSQVNFFGFSNPQNVGKTVEVLTLFRSEHPIDDTELNLKRDFLIDICWSALKSKGYRFAHATCTQKILPLYKRWGFDVLGEQEIDGLKRFHISYQD